MRANWTLRALTHRKPLHDGVHSEPFRSLLDISGVGMSSWNNGRPADPVTWAYSLITSL